MKLLLLLTFMVASAFAESPQTKSTDLGLEMQLSTEIEFVEKVKVYTYSGKLIKEFPLTNVVNNDISVSDHVLVEQSDYAFDFLGDYYYFSELGESISIN